MISERGTSFGYDNLIVDMLGLGYMRKTLEDIPIILDVTHSLQNREVGATSSGGRRSQFMDLARAGVGLGIAGVFMEAHPDPNLALCDGPSALPLAKLEPVLEQLHTLDLCVKTLPDIDI